MSIIRMMILAALLVYGIHLGQAFTTEYRNNTTENNTPGMPETWKALIGAEPQVNPETTFTPGVVKLGSNPSPKTANTELYEGLHLTYEQAFPISTHIDGWVQSTIGPVPFAYFDAPATPAEPIIGFH